VPTYGEFHEAVRVVQEVIQKYLLLLTHKSVTAFEPAVQYDTFEVFTKPWIPDPERFDYNKAEQ
jgi:hypothetical protein